MALLPHVLILSLDDRQMKQPTCGAHDSGQDHAPLENMYCRYAQQMF